jgi:two-component system sensor histidine kinase HydH
MDTSYIEYAELTGAAEERTLGNGGMLLTPRAGSRYQLSPATGNREREIRRLLLRAVVIFVLFFFAHGAVAGWIVFRDLDRRALQEKLLETRQFARGLADELARQVAPHGSFESVRLIESQAVVSRMLDDWTLQTKVVKRLQIQAHDGRVIAEFFPDQGGRSVRYAGTAFGGAAPVSPDSPPISALPRNRGMTEVRTIGAERVVEVPVGAGAAKLMLAIVPDALEEEALALRRSLMRQLLIGGAISSVILALAFLYVLRLIQRTRRLEAESQKAEQLASLGTLASGLAHEIRNPLNAMNINLQMLEEELSSSGIDADTLQLLKSSRGEVLRLERLVKDFLAFAKPRVERREEIAPGELVADVLRFSRPQFHAAGLRLELKTEEGAPAVWVDPARIRQALLNILQNALEVSPKGGAVVVTVGATAQGEARIDIADQGPGIDGAALGHIFEVFWSKKPAGSGLGLPIARRSVELHGGRIEVETAIGKVLPFPAAVVEMAREDQRPEAPPGPAAGTPP